MLAVFVLPIEQVDVDGLADQVSQILAREFHKARAEKNVVMNVVDPEGQIGQPDFGGVGL